MNIGRIYDSIKELDRMEVELTELKSDLETTLSDFERNLLEGCIKEKELLIGIKRNEEVDE